MWDKVLQFSALIGENILKIRIDSKFRMLTKLLFGFLLFFLKKRLLILLLSQEFACSVQYFQHYLQKNILEKRIVFFF